MDGCAASGESEQPVEIVVACELWRSACPDIEEVCLQAVRAVLAERRCGEVSVLLDGNLRVRDLNSAWRNRDMPTNVLAFPAGPPPSQGVPHPLGSIVLAYETVCEESRDQGRMFRDHAAHLVVHGTLHLLGYDHVRDEDAAAMESRESRILGSLGLDDPHRGRVDR